MIIVINNVPDTAPDKVVIEDGRDGIDRVTITEYCSDGSVWTLSVPGKHIAAWRDRADPKYEGEPDVQKDPVPVVWFTPHIIARIKRAVLGA